MLYKVSEVILKVIIYVNFSILNPFSTKYDELIQMDYFVFAWILVYHFGKENRNWGFMRKNTTFGLRMGSDIRMDSIS